MRRENYLDGTTSGCNINAWNSNVKFNNILHIFSYTGAGYIYGYLVQWF